MQSYKLLNKLDDSKDSNKYIAVKYEAGKVKIEKYGEATLSGHFLVMTRHGEFPPVYAKQVEEKAHTWLKEMGLEECQDEIIDKIQLPWMTALTAPGVDPEKLELGFKVLTFAFLLDNAVTKLRHLNKKNAIKQQEDITKVVQFLVSIIRTHGSGTSTDAAISNLNPIFESTCIALSHSCRIGFKQMHKDHYEILARDIMDYIRVHKWMQEEHNSPYNEDEYSFVRRIDIGTRLVLEPIVFAKDIRISHEIRMHPSLQRFIDMLGVHVALVNDILSIRKETAENERENILLVKCQKYSLQRSIHKAEKTANKLIFELKKCGTKLNSYFPSDYNVKAFVETIEFMIDGFVYWYQESKRYGDMKFEKYVVEYDFDYNNLLNEICAIDIKYMKEPTLSE